MAALSSKQAADQMINTPSRMREGVIYFLCVDNRRTGRTTAPLGLGRLFGAGLGHGPLRNGCGKSGRQACQLDAIALWGFVTFRPTPATAKAARGSCLLCLGLRL